MTILSKEDYHTACKNDCVQLLTRFAAGRITVDDIWPESLALMDAVPELYGAYLQRVMSAGPLKTNAANCLKCEDFVQSKNRHDFVTCSCGNIAVDGGTDYARRVGNLDGTSEDVIERWAWVKNKDA